MRLEEIQKTSSLMSQASRLFESVQREWNSQFLLGKETGYHYTMDAFCWLNQFVKDQFRFQGSGFRLQ